MEDNSDCSNRPVVPGRYLEQVLLTFEIKSLQRRAAALALSDELTKLGVSIDPITGVVTVGKIKSSLE